MAYDTVANIVSDAAVELGLGSVSDVYGSTDSSIIQLRTLLKSAGRDLVLERDWTHLQAEALIMTRAAWAASTHYYDSNTSVAWQGGSAYVVGDIVLNNAALYVCTTAGTSGTGSGPYVVGTGIVDGTAIWSYLNSGDSSAVVRGGYYYTCSTDGTSGTVGPCGQLVGGQETDGSVVWACSGLAGDYALPAGFRKMLPSTNWNRSTSWPMGGPVSPQGWQMLKARMMGATFSMLYRIVGGVLRFYPDSDTTAGQLLAYEYMSKFWVSATGLTAPTTDAPTANSDIIYFDPLLMTKRIKRDWLANKGFDATEAKREYAAAYSKIANTDNSAPVLSLSGGASVPLLGDMNIPFTGYGS
jgi:hypothetical protein